MNWLSGLFSGVKNLLGGAGKAIGQGAKAIAGAGTQFGSGLAGSQGFGMLNSAFGSKSNQPPPPPRLSGVTPPARSFSTASFPVMAQVAGGGMPGADSLEPEKKKKNWLEGLFPGGKEQGIAGLAAPLLGDMLAPKSPEIPNFGSLDSVKALQGFKPGNSVSPEYQQMLQRNTQQLRDTKVRELQALYHNARPGTDYLTDTNYQRDLAKLDQDIQMNMSDNLAKAEGTFSAQEQDRLSELAQMDIYSIMAQTGLDAQEASDFKEMFSNIGNTFLTNATRKPNQFDLSSLFGS